MVFCSGNTAAHIEGNPQIMSWASHDIISWENTPFILAGILCSSKGSIWLYLAKFLKLLAPQ